MNNSYGGYFANGRISKLHGGTTVTAIAVDGSNVYLAGSTNYPGSPYSVATYWKNGVPTIIGNNSGESSATGIAVDSGNIYVIGNVFIDSGTIQPTYWKNGVATAMTATLVNGKLTWVRAITIQNGSFYIAGTLNFEADTG